MRAYEAKKGMMIKMSKAQLAYNIKIEKGFLPMLVGLIPFLTETVLPAVGLKLYEDWIVRVFKSKLEMVCILRRVVVSVRLKLMGKDCT